MGPVTQQVVKEVTTHIKAAGGYVKEIWLVTGWAIYFLNTVILHLLAYEDGTDRVFRNVGI